MRPFYISSVVLVVLLLFTCSNCKKKQHKYPEDPKITKKTPKERLAGSWKISAYTLNEKDIIPDLEAVYNYEFKISAVNFVYNRNPSEGVPWSFGITGGDLYYESETAFDDYNYLEIKNDTRCCNFILSKWFITPFKYNLNTVAQWKVTKLFDKDLNLVLETDTGEYKIFLRKKN